MFYSPAHGLVFQHVHKTAGQSLVSVLRDQIDDLQELPGLPDAHYTLTVVFETLRSQGIDPTGLRFLATVCHPLAHAVSIYHYWRSERIPEQDRLLPHVALTRSLGFDDFLRQVLVLDQFEENLAVDGSLPDNVVLLRRESLRRDTEEVLTGILGREVRVRMPVLNRSSHRSPETYLGVGTEEALAESYRWTFEQGLYEPGMVPPDDTRPPRLGRTVQRMRRALGRI